MNSAVCRRPGYASGNVTRASSSHLQCILMPSAHGVAAPRHTQQRLTTRNITRNGYVTRRSTAVVVKCQQDQAAVPVAPGVAQAKALTISAVTSALWSANKAWELYDRDKSGKLCIDETVELVNSPELKQAAHLLTNVAQPDHTKEELQKLFNKADIDRSGNLNRLEFLALYLAVVTERVKKNPLILAEALLGFIDVDRNGKIEGKELKVLLTMVGVPAVILMPIPQDFGVDYREILGSIKGIMQKQGMIQT